jgi:calmodulin
MSVELEDYEEEEEFQLTDDQVLDFKDAFKKFDEDGSGEISTEELGTVMRMLGHELKQYQLEDCIAIVDADGSGSVDFEEFLDLMRMKTKESQEEAEVKEAFRILDRQNKGEINTSVIKEILMKLDDEITEDDVDEMIYEIDEDGSGWVDYEEFKKLMLG